MRTKRSILLTVILLISLLVISSLTASFAAKPVTGPTATVTLNKIDTRNNLAIVSASWSGYEGVSTMNIDIYIKFPTFDQAIGGNYYDIVTNEFAIKRDIVSFPYSTLPDTASYYAVLLLRDSNGFEIAKFTSDIKIGR